MNLPDDEAADLRMAYLVAKDGPGFPHLLAHVADLCDAYRAQGYVMGDLAHDGTLRLQAEAGADDGGWICEVYGCWNRTGDPCKFDGDDAHQAEEQ